LESADDQTAFAIGEAVEGVAEEAGGGVRGQDGADASDNLPSIVVEPREPLGRQMVAASRRLFPVLAAAFSGRKSVVSRRGYLIGRMASDTSTTSHPTDRKTSETGRQVDSSTTQRSMVGPQAVADKGNGLTTALRESQVTRLPADCGTRPRSGQATGRQE
jgi:hypothetical protein